MWKRQVVVKNLSGNCSASHLQNYLEVELEVEVEDNGVAFLPGISHTALVTLTEQLNADQLGIICQGLSPLNAKVPTILPVKSPPTAIIIRELDPELSLSEDYIMFYFESPRSGGQEEGVKENGVTIHQTLKLAVVEFVSCEVAKGVLAVPDHTLKGVKLHVEPYYEQFHAPLIEELLHVSKMKSQQVPATPPSAATPQAGNLTASNTGASNRPSIPAKPKPKAPPKPTMKNIQQPYPPQQAEQQNFCDDDEEEFFDCPNDVHADKQRGAVPFRESYGFPAPKDQQNRGRQKQDHWKQKSYPEMVHHPPRNVHQGSPRAANSRSAQHQGHETMTRDPYSAPGLHEKQQDHTESDSEDGYSFAEKHRMFESMGFQHGGGAHPGVCGDSFGGDIHEEVTSEYQPSRVNFEILMEDSDHKSIVSDSDSLNEPVSRGDAKQLGTTCDKGDKVSDPSAAEGKTTPSKDAVDEELLKKLKNLELENKKLKEVEVQHMNVPAYQLALLSDFAKCVHGCKVTVRKEQNLVLLTGTKEDCEAARCELLTLVQGLSECVLQVSPPIIKILKSVKGCRYFTSMLQNHPKCSTDTRDSSVVFAARELKDAEVCKEDFEKRILKKSLEVHTRTLQHASFQSLKTRLEEEYHVYITLPAEGSSEISVDGFDGDVEISVREIEELNETYKPDSEIFDIPGNLAKRACDTWFSKELEEVKGLILQSGGDVTRLDTGHGLTLSFVCRKEVLQTAKKTLTEIKESIVVSSLNLKSKFKSYSDCALVINGLHVKGVKEFCLHLDHYLSKEEGFDILVELTVPPKCDLPQIRAGTKGSENPFGGSGHHDRKPHSGRGDHRRGDHHAGRRGDHSPQRRSQSRFMRSQSVTLGNATFIVKSGNISREKVDVLVNITTEDFNMKHTAVGSAILRRYPQVGKLLQAQKGGAPVAAGQCLVYMTQIPAAQQSEERASVILHVVLKRCQPQAVTAYVKQVVQVCLQLAAQAGKTSISFPPLGCGRMFKYPEDAVADAMIASITEYLQGNPGAIQKVTLIVYDPEQARFFRETMRKKLCMPSAAEAAAAVVEEAASEEAAEGSEDDEAGDEDESDDEDSGFIAAAPQDESQDSKTISGKFEAKICTRLPADCHDVIKDRLLKYLQTIFLYRESPKDGATFRRLHQRAIDEIKQTATKNGVLLTMYGGEPWLDVCGEKLGVKDVIALIAHKFLEYKDLQDSSAHDCRKKLGLPVDTNRTPSYWGKSSKKPGAAVHSGGVIKPVPVKAAERKAVEDLIMATWESDKVGAGADARGLNHQSIKVLKVERLENLLLWENYRIRRERFFKHLEDSRTSALTQLESILPKGAVKTTQNLEATSLLKREIYPQVNEHYLFHGTKADVVKGIYRDGLDFRLAKKNMLGQGVYAAESSTKADQYADQKEQRSPPGTTLTMILMRVVLGDPFIHTQQQPPHLKRPPCRNCKQSICSCNARQYDSVIDDATRIFREFVVYEQSLCYPEYFISYQRV